MQGFTEFETIIEYFVTVCKVKGRLWEFLALYAFHLGKQAGMATALELQLVCVCELDFLTRFKMGDGGLTLNEGHTNCDVLFICSHTKDSC